MDEMLRECQGGWIIQIWKNKIRDIGQMSKFQWSNVDNCNVEKFINIIKDIKEGADTENRRIRDYYLL